ncbi:hypothetical protein EVAR_20176_1 [Eumeta japonica]|uniref:Uncharacterized protein n=1 Tax=Eumeta variegata TaxID=151549 RepID=A0A4C1UV00_EUMVA|nr:hypothetical protein EVAR_20176_1 [Eumeta japonica]
MIHLEKPGPDLLYGFLGFSPEPRGFKGPPAKSRLPKLCVVTPWGVATLSQGRRMSMRPNRMSHRALLHFRDSGSRVTDDRRWPAIFTRPSVRPAEDRRCDIQSAVATRQTFLPRK